MLIMREGTEPLLGNQLIHDRLGSAPSIKGSIMENIAAIVEDGLCTGCGTCAGICPTGAIKMRMSKGLYSPEIEEDKCIACGLCFKSCPGYSIDFEELNSRIFEKQPEDRFIGNYLKCYVGHSNDKEVRYGSSSGGIATQLLIFALEKGLIDGALVTRMSENQRGTYFCLEIEVLPGRGE
jgi:coenzyme F420 hydrogenase subunit beta